MDEAKIMHSHRKVNRKGRSSGSPLPQTRKFLSPPQGESWTFLTREMLDSPAWRAMPPHTFKLICCLMSGEREAACRRCGTR